MLIHKMNNKRRESSKYEKFTVSVRTIGTYGDVNNTRVNRNVIDKPTCSFRVCTLWASKTVETHISSLFIYISDKPRKIMIFACSGENERADPSLCFCSVNI